MIRNPKSGASANSATLATFIYSHDEFAPTATEDDYFH